MSKSAATFDCRCRRVERGTFAVVLLESAYEMASATATTAVWTGWNQVERKLELLIERGLALPLCIKQAKRVGHKQASAVCVPEKFGGV